MGQGILTVVKVAFTILLIPFVFACASEFRGHFMVYPNNPQEFFFWGVFVFLMIFLFLYKFFEIYEPGQKIMQGLFSFAVPFDRLLAHSIPFYPMVILVILYLIKNLLGVESYNDTLLFFGGFSCAMHFVLSAQDLQNDDNGFIFRPTYFLSISVVFIINVIVVILLLDLVHERFTLLRFFDKAFPVVKDVYGNIFQLITFQS